MIDAMMYVIAGAFMALLVVLIIQTRNGSATTTAAEPPAMTIINTPTHAYPYHYYRPRNLYVWPGRSQSHYQRPPARHINQRLRVAVNRGPPGRRGPRHF